jgi:phage gp45-like
MRRASSRDTSDRVGHGVSRATVRSTDDSPLLQELALNGFAGSGGGTEQADTIEHAQPYGFTARPKGPSKDPDGGEGQRHAEAFVIHANGNRSHGVAAVVSDRRYRPNNLKEGEVVNHDDQDQQTYYSRDRVVIHVPAGKEVHVQTADGTHVLCAAEKVKIQRGDISVTCKKGKVYLGAEDGGSAVLTIDGPSTKVFAIIDGGDSPMQAAPIAKRTKKSSGGGGGGGGGGG